MGCFRALVSRILALVLLVALGGAAYLYRHEIVGWWRDVRGGTSGTWTAPAPEAGRRARATLERIGAPGGPAYEDLDASEVSALVADALARTGTHAVDSVQVALGIDEVLVRCRLDMSGVPRSVLGPLASMVGDHEPATIGGPLSVDASGRLLLTVTTLRLRDFPFPRSTIPRILEAARVPGLAGGTVALPVAVRLGDVRVSPTHVRVYRSSPR
jgi:hypothetical protein